MKKMILSTLFSVTLLMGTTGTFADTITPEEPTTPPSGEVIPPTDGGDQPTDPVLPPNIGDSGTGGDTGTTTPPDTGDSGTGGGDTGTPTPPDTGDSGTGGGDTGIPTPPDTGDSGTGGDTGTPTPPDTGDTGTTTPPDTGNNGAGGNTGTTTPPNTGNDGTGGNTGATTPPTNGNSGGQTTTPPTTNVGINSDGTINQSGNAIQTTPIQTNNVNELTHIPTASTPVETDTGEKIVSVIDGVPYKQTEQGLTPVAAKVTKLPSGNIAVKGSDGQVKVLPKTGEKAISAIVTLIGGILTSTSGWFFWKKRRV